MLCGVRGFIPYQREDITPGIQLFFSRKDNSAVGSDLISELVLITNKITMTIKEWEARLLVSIFYGLYQYLL